MKKSEWAEEMAEVCGLGRFLLSCNVIDIEFANGQKLDVYLALTMEQRQRGLADLSTLDLDGMLFYYPQISYVPFIMKDMKMDLDIAFFNKDGKLLNVFTATAGSGPVVLGQPFTYVLECPAGSFPQSDLKVRGISG